MQENSDLPSLSEKISEFFGFKLPIPALPQTLKNFDKAISRIMLACGENIASRVERDSMLREARTKSETKIINASGNYVIEQIKKDGALVDRALEYSFKESMLKQSNREAILKLTFDDLNSETINQSTDAQTEIDDDWLNHMSSPRFFDGNGNNTFKIPEWKHYIS